MGSSSPIFGVKIKNVWKHHPEKKRVFWEISMCNTANLWQNQGTSNFSKKIKKMIKHFHLNMHFHVLPHGCWTKNKGILPPKWMVYFILLKWMIWGVKTPIFGLTPHITNQLNIGPGPKSPSSPTIHTTRWKAAKSRLVVRWIFQLTKDDVDGEIAIYMLGCPPSQ